jgi:hypothetical protein
MSVVACGNRWLRVFVFKAKLIMPGIVTVLLDWAKIARRSPTLERLSDVCLVARRRSLGQ